MLRTLRPANTDRKGTPEANAPHFGQRERMVSPAAGRLWPSPLVRQSLSPRVPDKALSGLLVSCPAKVHIPSELGVPYFIGSSILAAGAVPGEGPIKRVSKPSRLRTQGFRDNLESSV